MYLHTNIVYTCDTLQNGAIGWRGGDEMLNKVVIFVFFALKKYSRSFVKVQLITDITWIILMIIKNILICVLKMNEGLAGLERHDGE